MRSKKLIMIFVTSLLLLPSLLSVVNGNFLPVDNHISIISPSYDPREGQYYCVNSTVKLEISVVLVKEGLTEPPKVHFISYSLDGQPLVYLRNLTVTNHYYSQYKQDIIRYEANSTLEGLSEGNHTIQAYANDMSTSRTFTVDSYHTIPAINILSPTNQTYSGNIPLVFTVNVNFTKASYLMWDWKKMDSHYDGQLTGNSTLENLPSGDYIIKVHATTDKGEYVGGSASFTVSTFNFLENAIPNQSSGLMIGIIGFIGGILALVCVIIFYYRTKNANR